MSDDLEPNDPIVGFLRSADPGDPPVTLGPGSSLRHRAAVRHARRQAAGAVLAVGLIAVAVVGSVVGTRHHPTVTPAAHDPITSPSISTRSDQSALPSKPETEPPATTASQIISAPTSTVASETDRPNTHSTSPEVPRAIEAYIRDVGPVAVGQTIYFTVHYTLHGTVAANWETVDFGDTTVVGEPQSCTTTTAAPTGASGGDGPAEFSTPSHFYSAPGTYTVRVTMGFGCTTGAKTTTVSRTVVVTGPAPSTSPAVPASELPSPIVTPSAPASGSATPTP